MKPLSPNPKWEEITHQVIMKLLLRNQSERIETGGKEGGGWQFVLNGQRMKRWQVKVSNLKGLLVDLIPINGQGTKLH